VAGLVEVGVRPDSNGSVQSDPDQGDLDPDGPASNDLDLNGRARRGSGPHGPATSDADLYDLGASDPGLDVLDASALVLRDLIWSRGPERVFHLATVWERASLQSLPRGRDICR